LQYVKPSIPAIRQALASKAFLLAGFPV